MKPDKIITSLCVQISEMQVKRNLHLYVEIVLSIECKFGLKSFCSEIYMNFTTT